MTVAPAIIGAAGGTGRDSSNARLLVLDAARFLAAVAIVWLHVIAINPVYGWLADLGRFAVPFFVLTTIVLMGDALRRSPERRYFDYLSARFQRLYVPFLAWTMVYLLLRDFKYLLTRQPGHVPVGLDLLVVGSTHHLWFLPFLLLVSAVLFPVARRIARRSAGAAALGVVCLILSAVVAVLPPPLRYNQQATDFLGRVSYAGLLGWGALPAALLGAAAVFATPYLKTVQGGRSWIAAGLLLVVALGMVGLALTGRSILTETALGACLLAAALLAPWQGRLINLMGRLGQCAYGIYLSHVAFVLVPETALGRSRESIGLCVLIAIFLFAVAASTITSLGLRRWKLTRWLCA